MSKSIPTERELLRCIYNMYESSFPVEGPSIGKVMVEIDIEAIAKKLGCDKHILFGYLFYHLDHKYRYSTGENSSVHLFASRLASFVMQSICRISRPYLQGKIKSTP